MKRLRWILRSSKPNTDIARKLALTAAIAAALDSMSTYLAVSSGAVELNPIVALFLQDLALYVSFAIVKSWIVYIIFTRMNIRFFNLAAWAAITYLFLRASLINMINYMSHGV
jgi:hypothetical protein